MKLLVCGGRAYWDWERVRTALDRAHARRPVTLVIQGGADGADWLADLWAKVHCIRSTGAFYQVTPAMWKEQGRAAGPRRNARMLAEQRPDGVVAFPGGPGTADMVRQAEAAGVKVWRPYG